jgi:hypothetical protein
MKRSTGMFRMNTLAIVRPGNREAVSLFAASEAHGIKLRNSPAYIRKWVGRERA